MLDGLTNGTSYTVYVRGVSADGVHGDVASVTAKPYKPIGAPSNIRFSTSNSVVTFSWDAPTVGRRPAGAWCPGAGRRHRRPPHPAAGLGLPPGGLEGTADAQLSQGPGHYVGTALPGEPGNLAIAGHRVGKGSPFLELDTMRPGDPIVVETADSWFTYRVLGDQETGDFTGDPSGVPGQQIVLPTQIDVISPVPGGDTYAEPDGAFLTLTTCHPRFSAEQRLVVHAVLDGAPMPKADFPDGPPSVRDR